MTHDETPAGTPVVEFDEDEYKAFLEAEVQRRMKMSVDEFVKRFDAGDLDDDPDVGYIAGLLSLGQNGSPARP